MASSDNASVTEAKEPERTPPPPSPSPAPSAGDCGCGGTARKEKTTSKGGGKGKGKGKGKGEDSPLLCGWCEKPGAKRRCSQCKSEVYCNEACQRVGENGGGP